MKCIFLDFDGVINNWYQFEGVSLDNALVLLEILKKTNAKIIATTSKKYSIQNGYVNYYDSKYYKSYVKKLNELGIEIYDMTPKSKTRTLEILKYLEEHDVEDYVILDDELVDPILQEHQVFLDLYKGLQKEHIEPALKILNGELGFSPKNYNRKETPHELCLRINQYYENNKEKK